jgi:hypothetical protein
MDISAYAFKPWEEQSSIYPQVNNTVKPLRLIKTNRKLVPHPL